ncbi:hypothetical protein DIS24_g10523 [Lasiodiplodia hormozganensis]|uniref:Uncharacterized protein n=2 Tax=Lasiodiplodia TaxID=66739 RepID=A0A5N5D9J0_9PEZI|nr:uncharacterized protein LTHEOB_6866 [Lasiodiplodia theobromae]KAB2574265.1 hypothetical protein DBV05_g7127 [Lasiodiplodia theobromae]KAF4543132.1 hypothetical protein LTHEOB_6866 [Lasiodiplodia theobromae]KAK0637737.1 hypothetical protein DIS24_g10523 [Lasiodiplodia hormozganensis]
MAPLGPYKLVTVNNAPERAKRLIGRVVEDVKDRYTIIHAGNADDLSKVEEVVTDVKPDLLFTASMWTPEQSQTAQETARKIVPNVKTFALPQGLQVERGPDAVVEYIKENLPALLEGEA